LSRKKQGLESLLQELRKTRGSLSLSNLSKFFTMLKERLKENDWDLISLTLQVTQDIIPVFSN
jgi:hypothetical protein